MLLSNRIVDKNLHVINNVIVKKSPQEMYQKERCSYAQCDINTDLVFMYFETKLMRMFSMKMRYTCVCRENSREEETSKLTYLCT